MHHTCKRAHSIEEFTTLEDGIIKPLVAISSVSFTFWESGTYNHQNKI
jgi:hypothetical protein